MASHASWLEPATLGTIAAALAAVITLAVMIVWRFRDKRRRVITYWTSATSLLSSAPPRTSGGAIQVTYGGMAIGDPYLLTLRVDMRGPRDISNTDFNGGKALVFRFGVPLIAAVDESFGLEDGDLSIAAGSLSIGPRLIHKGLVARLQLVTDGNPDVVADSPLIDVPVQKLADASQGNMFKKVLTWAGVAFVFYYLVTIPHWFSQAGKSMADFLNHLTLPGWVVPIIEAVVILGVLLARRGSAFRRWLHGPAGARGDPGTRG